MRIPGAAIPHAETAPPREECFDGARRAGAGVGSEHRHPLDPFRRSLHTVPSRAAMGLAPLPQELSVPFSKVPPFWLGFDAFLGCFVRKGVHLMRTVDPLL